MSIKRLDWDSSFFKTNVYSLQATNTDEIINSLKKIETNSILYVFSEKYEIPNDILLNYGGKLVDVKTIFQKEIYHKNNIEENIVEFNKDEASKELYDLAFESGKFSRFKIDNRLPEDSFKKLYSKWIEKSITSNDIKVFVINKNNKAIAFVTLIIENNVGNIGLIAVNNNFQGQGLGKNLLLFCENYLIDKGIKSIKIPTQYSNIAAVKFYLKNNYKIIEQNNIYHFFNNENSF